MRDCGALEIELDLGNVLEREEEGRDVESFHYSITTYVELEKTLSTQYSNGNNAIWECLFELWSWDSFLNCST